MRGQTELVALGVAFVVLTGATVAGVVFAHSSLATAERDSLEQQTAKALSERLVSAQASHTARENVLINDTLSTLDETTRRKRYNVPEEAEIRLVLGDGTVVRTGPTTEGTTVERLVLVEERTTKQLPPEFDSSRTTTLPRRTSTVRLTITPSAGTTVERVFANSRVVLSNASGLRGSFNVSLSSFETATLRFDAVGALDSGSVTIAYEPTETGTHTITVRFSVAGECVDTRYLKVFVHD